jgi:succinylarginine dihydrolase
MQTDALYETIGSADERDTDVGRYASRQTQGAADAGVTRAGNDDAMVFHARQTGQAERL